MKNGLFIVLSAIVLSVMCMAPSCQDWVKQDQKPVPAAVPIYNEGDGCPYGTTVWECTIMCGCSGSWVPYYTCAQSFFQAQNYAYHHMSGGDHYQDWQRVTITQCVDLGVTVIPKHPREADACTECLATCQDDGKPCGGSLNPCCSGLCEADGNWAGSTFCACHNQGEKCSENAQCCIVDTWNTPTNARCEGGQCVWYDAPPAAPSSP